MATQNLDGFRVAILVAEGFEEVEMTKPRKALQDAGAKTDLISPKAGKVLSFEHHTPSKEYDVDRTLADVKANEYDALLLPGGVINPDTLRINADAVAFVKSIFEEQKPVAAICHGPWTLIEAGVVKGMTLTSWPSLKTDITNAGGVWIDAEVSQDRHLVTSRMPDDIPAFNERMIAIFAEARRPVTSGAN
jgi:protease I